MNIKQTFLNLTNHTYPDGNEKDMFHLMPEGYKTDFHGNLYYLIGDNPTTMFTSHLDTAGTYHGAVKHVIEDGMIKTDGESILGADDKTGVTIMLYMIEKKVPGLYYFFLAEEVGCVGSRAVATKWGTKKEDVAHIENMTKCVAFDRKGYNSVISHMNKRTASDDFCDALAKELNGLDDRFDYKKDHTGGSTDSGKFAAIIPECTNLSVGYFHQHQSTEKQDLEFMEKLCVAACKVKWEELPVKRNPKTDNESAYRYDNDYHDYYNNSGNFRRSSTWTNGGSVKTRKNGSRTTNYNSKYSNEPKSHKNFYDIKYNHLSSIEMSGDKITKVNFSNARIKDEKSLIEDLFLVMDLKPTELKWDGVTLSVSGVDTDIKEIQREELYGLLPELDYRLEQSAINS